MQITRLDPMQCDLDTADAMAAVHAASFDGDDLALPRVHVHPGHRRRGTGTALLDACEDTWNATTNHHMIAVNERLGCRVVAEHQAARKDVS